jgi:hypothetical protein
MPYTPTTWVEGVTTLGPTNMNKIEAGIASLSAPAPSTTPPGSPADGDIWYFPADATNGVIWQFRYNAGSASAYKWEFVGGSQLVGFVATEEGTTSTTYVALATAGPSVTLPRAGDYRVEANNFGYNPVGGSTAQMGVYLNGTTTGVSTMSTALSYSHVYRSFAVLGVTAGCVLSVLYRTVGSGQSNFGDRTLLVRPIRIS